MSAHPPQSDRLDPLAPSGRFLRPFSRLDCPGLTCGHGLILAILSHFLNFVCRLRLYCMLSPCCYNCNCLLPWSLKNKFGVASHFILSLHPDMSKSDPNPKTLKWWLQLAVAILSALIGMLAEGKLQVASSFLNP